MNLLGKRIAVKLDKPPEKSPGGIFLPQDNIKRSVTGVVTHVNTKIKSKEIKVGDKVAFSQYAGVEIDGLLILPLKEVIAVLPKENDYDYE